jgi:hypothetical protein
LRGIDAQISGQAALMTSFDTEIVGKKEIARSMLNTSR